MYIESLNSDSDQKDYPNIKLSQSSQILKSEINGKIWLDKMTTVSRSKISGYTAIGCFTLLSRSNCSPFITIGSRCSIGPFDHPQNWISVMEFQYRNSLNSFGEGFHDESLHVMPNQKITSIGGDVWIGDNVYVKAGVNIGDGAIIGASTAVTKDLEPFSINVGNPSRIIKYRFSREMIEKLLQIRWWEKLTIEEMSGISFSNPEKALFELENLINRKSI